MTKVLETVEKFYQREESTSANLVSVQNNHRLDLIHFDTLIACWEYGNLHINNVFYSRTTSRFTDYLKTLCEGNTPYKEFSGKPSNEVQYYEMGVRR